MDRAACDGDDLAARPSWRGQAGGVDRSRAPGAPDSAKLCRQEYSDLAHRTRAGAPGRGRQRSESQIARPRHDLFNRRTDERTRGGALNAILLKGGRVIDPANALDGENDVLLRDGEIAGVQPAGTRFRGATAVDPRGRWVVAGLV